MVIFCTTVAYHITNLLVWNLSQKTASELCTLSLIICVYIYLDSYKTVLCGPNFQKQTIDWYAAPKKSLQHSQYAELLTIITQTNPKSDLDKQVKNLIV